jgi:hypothetical protein
MRSTVVGMVNLLREEFREVEIKGCRLHFGQAWYRKIQSLGLAQDYKDKSSEIGKWLSQFFGLPFYTWVCRIKLIIEVTVKALRAIVNAFSCTARF